MKVEEQEEENENEENNKGYEKEPRGAPESEVIVVSDSEENSSNPLKATTERENASRDREESKQDVRTKMFQEAVEEHEKDVTKRSPFEANNKVENATWGILQLPAKFTAG